MTQETTSNEEKKQMSPKNRNALLRYMEILFVVAFIVVGLSLLVQMRNSQNTITALNQTSKSALENAEHLQAENQTLSTQNDSLQQKNYELTDRIEELEKQVQSADEEKKTLQGEKDAAQRRADAYRLLYKAAPADPAQQEYETAMKALAPLSDALDADAKQQYDAMPRPWETEERE